MINADQQWMSCAIEQAKLAEQADEVPIGAVIIHNNQVIAKAHNQTIMNHDATAHAEICCIRAAGKHLKNHRLIGTTLYVTLEPCIMCYGAIVQARIERVVFGAADPKNGVFSQPKLLEQCIFNHTPKFTGGIQADTCGTLLKDFFANRR